MLAPDLQGLRSPLPPQLLVSRIRRLTCRSRAVVCQGSSRVAVGIDLGTTNSLIAVAAPEEQPSIVTLDTGSYFLPSVVHYTADSVTVGDKAKEAATEDP